MRGRDGALAAGQVITMLGKAGAALAQGQSVAQVCRALGVTAPWSRELCG